MTNGNCSNCCKCTVWKGSTIITLLVTHFFQQSGNIFTAVLQCPNDKQQCVFFDQKMAFSGSAWRKMDENAEPWTNLSSGHFRHAFLSPQHFYHPRGQLERALELFCLVHSWQRLVLHRCIIPTFISIVFFDWLDNMGPTLMFWPCFPG
jgi:hypothetical protein